MGFFNADQIVYSLLEMGMRPFVELSFMPDKLASGGETVFRYAANASPPIDPRAWGKLIEELVSHRVDRYGLDEVSGWDFEVWNEPNLDSFWSGTQDQYFELYRHTAEAIKGADPSLPVGGPATARVEWLQDLRDFSARENLPLDSLTTHSYPTDALRTPSTDTRQQLSNAPDDVMRQQA